MKKLLLALLLAALPSLALAQNPSTAQWQGTRTAGDAIVYQNTGKGVTIQSMSNRMGGPITNSAPFFSALSNMQYGPVSCAQQYPKFLAAVRVYSLYATCATMADGTTSLQFVPGLFSIDDYSTTGGSAIPLIAQATAEVSNKAEYGINTLHIDSPTLGTGSASSIAGTVLTIAGTVTGSFRVGDWLAGTGVLPSTQITSLGTGTGGAGTYNINNSQSVSSTLISDHLAGISNITLQDELDFFGFQSDTKSRLLIDGYFPNGAATGAPNKREGVVVGVFGTSIGNWQHGFATGDNGGAAVAFVAGTSATTVNVANTNAPSQSLDFRYYDQTNTTARELFLKADPSNAGSTGADLTVTSSYAGAANLSVPTGSLKVGGKNVASSAGAAVHQQFLGRTNSVTGAGATQCGGISGLWTAAACGSAFWMVTNQAGQLSNLVAKSVTSPGGSESYAVTVFYNAASTPLTCTITGASSNCSDTTHTVAVAAFGTYYVQIVGSAAAPANSVMTAISFDNPAP